MVDLSAAERSYVDRVLKDFLGEESSSDQEKKSQLDLSVQEKAEVERILSAFEEGGRG